MASRDTKPQQLIKTARNVAPASTYRSKYKSFTQLNLEERKEIERLIKKHYSLSHIGVKLQRGKNTVVNEVRRAGGREKYNAEKADKEAHERLISSKQRLVKNFTPENKLTLNQRIENLEMQIEILIETIKEMKNERST